MLAFKEWLISTLNADTTLQTLLGATSTTMPIYPVDVDLQPEQFPCITYQDVANTVLSVPQGTHIGIIQLDIWSTNTALETEQIYDRLQTLLNFQSNLTASVSIAGKLWWLRENSARDMHTPSRRIWRKSMDLKFWVSRSDNL